MHRGCCAGTESILFCDTITRITSHETPDQLYDYFGFPESAYELDYRPPGDPKFAKKLAREIGAAGLPVRRTRRRGFDHGVFVPLKLMYPEADIPVIQISLHASLDPKMHLELGKAIQRFRELGVLIIGRDQYL